MENMEENSDKIWSIWKKDKLKGEKIWKILFFKSFHYFPNLITIQLGFLPYFPYLFTIQLTFLPYFPYLFTIQLIFLSEENSEKIGKLWKKIVN
jgi:hypothetical protein